MASLRTGLRTYAVLNIREASDMSCTRTSNKASRVHVVYTVQCTHDHVHLLLIHVGIPADYTYVHVYTVGS